MKPFTKKLVLENGCEFLGYSEAEFWKVIDKFYNRDIFEKDSAGRWVLKDPIWNQK